MQKSKAVPVFPADGGLRIVRRESRERAELLEKLGALRPEFDNRSGILIGFRIVGIEMRKVDSDLESTYSDCGISAREMDLNVERSQTRGLNEEHRLERVKNGLAPEDVIERVQAKVRVYAVIGSNRRDVLRVWPR